MDDAAEVLQQCAQHPDDDSPRLVWADIVGGERGELVVLQCDLARGNLSFAEAAKRRTRERELLEKYGVEWAGDLAEVASRWAFHRGFIESVKVHALAFALARLPRLVANVELPNNSDASVALLVELARRRRGLRGLALDRPRFATTDVGPEFTALRALAMHGPTLDTLLPLLRDKPITQLRLRSHRFVAHEVEQIVEAAPQLASLDLWPEVGHSDEGFAAVFMHRPLRALRTKDLGWKNLMYMAKDSAETLEHLAFPLAHDGARTIEMLFPYRALRTLELSGESYHVHAAIEALARSREGFGSLRVLRISEPLFGDELTSLRARFANQLEILETPYAHEPRLLHDTFASSFTLAAACYVKAPVVCIAQPGARVWEFPPRPADEPITIGRDGGNDLTLFSSFVARRHAGLRWENGAHVLYDFGSDNGTWIDGAMIEKQQIADGTPFIIGNVPLVYFAGDGAKERAQRIVQSVGGT